jgi:RNA polymerase sigma-70 factor (ECF subfamily)
MDVDDLTQEVFARVFVLLPTLRDPSALRPFVLSVAANVLKWELRRRWAGRTVRLSVTGKLPDIQGASADTEARQALRRCYRIFDTFRAQERMAFVLRYLEEMTIEEVAATLETSVSSAKRWVNRAARKMSARMAHDPDLRFFFAGAPEERK